MPHRAEIDGLRAVAILCVVLNHYVPEALPLGYLGVDVFFVISGFVIAGAIAGRTGEGLGPFLAGFYARRAKRLLPALVLCIAVTALLISFFSPAPGEYLKTGFFALFGLSNLYLFARSSDYFADSTALNPFTHTWSLGVEEQFYLVFPVLLWVGVRAFGLRGVSWALAGLSALSALAWGWAAAREPMAAFYLPIFRFWEIGLGAVLFLMGLEARGWVARQAGAVKALCLLGLVVLMAGLVPMGREVALALVVALSGLLIVLTGPGAAAAPVLRARPALYLGRISYSLYLWHWPVMVLFTWTIGFSAATAWLALGLALGLAHLSYTLVEQPLRQASWGSTPWRECLAGAGLAGTAGLAVFLLVKAPDDALYLGRPADLVAEGIRTLEDPYTSPSGAVWAGADCVLSSNDEVGAQIAAETCTVGASLAAAERRLLVVGDSFSAAFLQAFDGSASVSAIVTSSWGASFAPGVPNDLPWAEASAYYWEQTIPALVTRLSPGDRVAIVSDLSLFSPPEAGAREAALLDHAEAGLRAFSSDLAAHGIGLSVLGPLPFAREAACTPERGRAQWFAPAGASCRFLSRDATQARMAPMTTRLVQLEEAGVLQVLDLFDHFCDGATCDYVDADGALLYRDVYSHASVEAARAVRPEVARHLEALWGTARAGALSWTTAGRGAE